MSELLMPMPGHFDATTPPGLGYFNSKPRILFDDTTQQYIHWTFRMPANYSSSPVVKYQYTMASATTGNVMTACQVMSVSDGDATAIDSDSYDTENVSSATAVPGTAGHLDEISLSLTNADSLAAGDWVALKLSRDADNASDTATGDLELVAVSLTYTAA